MTKPTFEAVLDECIEDVRAGRRTPEQCLAAWPEFAATLEPLLRTATLTRAMAIGETAPNPARRAELMRAIRNTPQQRSNGLVSALFGALRALRGQGLIVVPAAMAMMVALVIFAGRATPRAEASTLTVFEGAVEEQHAGGWVPLSDGAHLTAGARVRTTAAGRALITFADGSTVALDPDTEMSIVTAKLNGPREITISQESGRLWHQVAPDQRMGSAFTVRTPSATVTAHGTVFETAIEDGATAVNTSEGSVEVVAGSQRVEVGRGQAASATRNAVRAVASAARASVSASVTVDAPFVASIVGPDGRATGALPTGMVYQQIPGAFSTDPTTGAQRIEFTDVRPGEYALLLRRTSAGAGTVTLSTQGDEQSVALSAEGDLYVLRLRITSAGGQAKVAPVATPAAMRPEAVKQERLVITERAKQHAEERLRSAVGPMRAMPGGQPGAPTRPNDDREERPAASSTPTSSDATSTATPPRSIQPRPPVERQESESDDRDAAAPLPGSLR
jgi:hypothetical protein